MVKENIIKRSYFIYSEAGISYFYSRKRGLYEVPAELSFKEEKVQELLSIIKEDLETHPRRSLKLHKLGKKENERIFPDIKTPDGIDVDHPEYFNNFPPVKRPKKDLRLY